MELSSESLTEVVIKNIQEAIRRGDILPGDMLPPQPQLAAQFGVGISTVREAIRALSMIGLVDVRSGRGTRVLPDAARVLNSMASVGANVGRVEFEQACEARVAIEVLLARLAAERATPTELAQLRQALTEMREHIHDTEAYLRADWRFHQLVAEAAKNPILAQMYQLVSGLLLQMLELTLIQPGSKERGIEFQEDLVEAMAARDPERAACSAQRHMESFRMDWLAGAAASKRPNTKLVFRREPVPTASRRKRKEVVVARSD